MIPVLLTGGCGYIGSHVCAELLSRGFAVSCYDNLANSSPEAINRVSRLAGSTARVFQGDIRDKDSLRHALQQSKAQAVVHFAGLKAVGESVAVPLAYYDNNVVGTICLLEAMREEGVSTLVFSSSATVYGTPQYLPLRENHPRSASSPYGRTKLIVEDVLEDLYASNNSWRIARLRYFNPVGAHPSGLIGEDPRGTPNNLMPYICQVAISKRAFVSVFGNDYPTPDGTGVRDYIHVMDLAAGHLAALDRLFASPKGELLTVNLGTGRGYSVLEFVAAFERCSGRKVPCRFAPRRPGDVASCYADPTLAKELLGWTTTRGLDEMCEDAWRWQSGNPSGFIEAKTRG
jgi:UDP-glucose 4-epimerase